MRRRDAPRDVYLALRRRPLAVLFAVLALIALGAAIVAAHVTTFALDETLIEQSAVHYTSDLPHSLFHDLDARATNRLYSLLLSIPFHLFSGVRAVEIDHILSAVLFVSAALPVFIFARVILRSVWSAVAVAILSVAVPWLALTTALFTENLSYPLFWWMVLATCAAVWRPSRRADLLAIVTIVLLVCTRVQFAGVFVGYLLALLAISYLRSAPSARRLARTREALRRALRGHLFSFLLLALAVVALIYERSRPHWEAHVEQLLGAYSNVIIRHALPSNMTEGLLIELIALALGVGLLPALVSIPWFLRRITRPVLDRRWVHLFAAAVLLVVFMVLTVYSQNGYLGAITEERYFFYVIPAFWLCAFAALEEGNVRPSDIALCAVALAAIYGAIPFLSPLSEESAFLAPVESVVPHVLQQRLLEVGLTGLSTQDGLAILVLLAGLATAAIWAHRPRWRRWWVIAPAAVLQLLITGYAYAVIDGKVQGIPGRTSGSLSALGWLDAHAGSTPVAWLVNVSSAAPLTNAASPSADEERTTLFWNKRLTSWVEVPGLGAHPAESPLAALPGIPPLGINRATGELGPPADTKAISKLVVGQTDSPFIQLAATPLATSPDGILTLSLIAHPVTATWISVGLQPDATVGAGPPAQLYVFAPRASRPQTRSVAFALAPVAPPGATTVLTLRLGTRTIHVPLSGGAPARMLTLDACFPAGSTVLDGTATPTTTALIAGRELAGYISSVTLGPPTPAPRC